MAKSLPAAEIGPLAAALGLRAPADACSAVKGGRRVEHIVHELISLFYIHSSGLRQIIEHEVAGQQIQEREDQEDVVVADGVADEREHEGSHKVHKEEQPVGQRVREWADVIRSDFIEQKVADGPQADLEANTLQIQTIKQNQILNH